MKILYYNWVDYEDAERRGGGVSVYQANIFSALTNKQPRHEVSFLCSGISYDLFNKMPRWEQIKHGPSRDKAKKFEIVNSEVMAPGHHSFGDYSQIDCQKTKSVFFDFIEKCGPFDVIHFNNLEGLPVSVLEIKKFFPNTKVMLSLHNYYAVCPQVNLWYREKENCQDYQDGWKCEDCLTFRYQQRLIKAANAVAYNLKKRKIEPGSPLFNKTFGLAFKLKPYVAKIIIFYRRVFSVKDLVDPTSSLERIQMVELKPDDHLFKMRREKFCQFINDNCDYVLAVSGRVKDIAIKFGIRPEIVRTSYIGTKHAEAFYTNIERSRGLVGPGGILTIAYLGYMRRDKGFYFLLDAIKQMPDDLASRIKVVLAARNTDDRVLQTLKRQSRRFAGIFYSDGYSHGQLDEILTDVNLGIVPVLWEDSLPQVAVEMHCRKIPLLTSDLGGAKELSNSNEDFVFENNNKIDFYKKLGNIISGEVDISRYWENIREPVSLDDHMAELMSLYSS